MRTADLLSPDDVVLDLAVANRRGLLDALSIEAAKRLGLGRQNILDALEAREQLGSTALRGGIAFPHTQLSGVDRRLMLFARLVQSIYLDSNDEEPIDLVFLMLWPAGNSKAFLEAMAEICSRLREPQLVRRLRDAAKPEEVVALLSHARDPEAGTVGPK